MKTYEEQVALVSRLNVMDDLFFQKVVDDLEVCEEMLRILMQKPTLKIVQAQPQRFIRNFDAHSVVLDLICEDADGTIMNIEVQKADDDDYQKRVRFNVSNIDTVFVEKGIPYKELPDVYVIFISQVDQFKQKRVAYHIRRSLLETDTTVENGIHEIYVNTANNDGSDIAELMQYFKKSVGEHKAFPKLSKRVKYLKEQQEGVCSMSDVVEEYANKVAKEKVEESERKMAITLATNFLLEGISVEIVAKSIPSLSLEFIKELKRQLPQG